MSYKTLKLFKIFKCINLDAILVFHSGLFRRRSVTRFFQMLEKEWCRSILTASLMIRLLGQRTFCSAQIYFVHYKRR
jgi:hypothetical protein